MMQLKSSGRGIQQEDVWQAADELLLEGQRPTIERIRLKIGRGSPNTISPMLENWFAVLGQRINGTAIKQEAAVAAPEPVEQAIRHAWELALEQASIIARQAIKNQQEENERISKALDAEKQEFEQAKRLHQAALLEQEKLLANVTAQLNDVRGLLAQRNNEFENLHREAGQLKIQIADLLTEKKALQVANQQALDNLNRQHAKEREGLEARFRSLELRSVSEIDRARQETKQLQKKHEQASKLHEDKEKSLKAQLDEAYEKHQQQKQQLETDRINLQALEEDNRLLSLQLKQRESQSERVQEQHQQQILQLKKENETLSAALERQQQNEALQQEMAQLLEKLRAISLTNVANSEKSSLNK
ncbi:DNA-binding protein [Advenella sp. RU8]|uniref:DNA-binding protein n=1 Tax=Advenella sp. RU8 TaxID=3399575 RepID=UPI003AADCD37